MDPYQPPVNSISIDAKNHDMPLIIGKLKDLDTTLFHTLNTVEIDHIASSSISRKIFREIFIGGETYYKSNDSVGVRGFFCVPYWSGRGKFENHIVGIGYPRQMLQIWEINIGGFWLYIQH